MKFLYLAKYAWCISVKIHLHQHSKRSQNTTTIYSTVYLSKCKCTRTFGTPGLYIFVDYLKHFCIACSQKIERFQHVFEQDQLGSVDGDLRFWLLFCKSELFYNQGVNCARGIDRVETSALALAIFQLNLKLIILSQITENQTKTVVSKFRVMILCQNLSRAVL